MKETLKSSEAPAAVGPYSQGIICGNLLFCSGQIPIDPDSGELIAGNASDQTRRALENLRGLLRGRSLTLDNVVKTTIFITDMHQFSEINEIYGKYFHGNFPARETVQVAALPRFVNVEISMIAVK